MASMCRNQSRIDDIGMRVSTRETPSPPSRRASPIGVGAVDILDAEQAAAVASQARSVIVRAGAGTGKTRTLVSRAARLIADGVNPSAIIVVTFTNKAAREVRGRLEQMVGPDARRVLLGTFHGISARILRNFPEILGLKDRDFVILDEEQAAELVGEACKVEPGLVADVREHILRERSTQEALGRWVPQTEPNVIEVVRRQIDLYRCWGLTLDDAAVDDRVKSPFETAIIGIWAQYDDLKRHANSVDFGDIVPAVIRLFRIHPDLGSQLAAGTDHILVDEAQDANPVQVEWVRLMASGGAVVFAVGDEDQNIYAFQGGYQGAMTDMAGSGAETISLVHNRRSTEEILAPANRIVAINRRTSAKILKSGLTGEPPRGLSYATDKAEATAVAAEIRALIAGGADASEIAILVRTRALMNHYERALISKSVPYQRSGSGGITESREVQDIGAYLRLVVDPWCEKSLARAAQRPARGIGTAVMKGILVYAGHGRTMIEVCRRACEAADGLKASTRASIEALAQQIEDMTELYRMGHGVAAVVDHVIDAIGYRDFVEKDTADEDDRTRRLEYIGFLRTLAGEADDIVDLMHMLALSTDVDMGDGGRDKGRVRLSTVHAAKGLEFDHVFCCAFEHRRFPIQAAVDEGVLGRAGSLWDGPRAGGVEEERRLAHVAFTRARKTLTVTAAVSRGGGGQKPDKGMVSRFMMEAGIKVESVRGSAAPKKGGTKGKASDERRKGYTRNTQVSVAG